MPSESPAAVPVVESGCLLVSGTTLVGPTFRRTVVYVVEHSRTGTLGVVLNRPTDRALAEVLAGWTPLAVRPQALFSGGPVSAETALCLGTVRVGAAPTGAVPGLRRVQGRVVLVDLEVDPAPLSTVLDGVRVFSGYAGWSAGQLDDEVAREDWLVVASLPSDVLDPGRGDLWARVLRRQPMPLALLATHPLEVERS